MGIGLEIFEISQFFLVSISPQPGTFDPTGLGLENCVVADLCCRFTIVTTNLTPKAEREQSQKVNCKNVLLHANSLCFVPQSPQDISRHPAYFLF